MKKQKGLKKLILMFLTIFSLSVVTFFSVQFYVNSFSRDRILTDIDKIPVCDAVLVLGAKVYSDGRPSPVLQDRLDYGYALYTAGKVKKLLLSGDHGQVEYDEVKGMGDYLLNKGVPREDIFLDHAGFDTYDSVYRAKEIFSVQSMVISTQEFHIQRALYMAEKLGITAYGYPCADKEIYNMNRLVVRESLAKVKAVLETEILRRKPKFLGDIIPIWGDGAQTDDTKESDDR